MLIETETYRTDDDTIELDESDFIAESAPITSEPVTLAHYDRSDARSWNREAGKIGWALLWLLGVPLPVLLIIYLIRGH